ncbi:hypothetical protein JG687_00002999 [Phytophthora cactorum]|uniref:Uncharacterized protein n=1 Tax=Phytophthora cactorum TaxID=29920 RepID=A0A8T1UTL4_9STRA|nr:hypothetical protein JG687_00002999 [Phytophthora cactorum]
MSAEYAARMEIMQRKREELTAQRQAIEKRMALHEATAAEFSAVALQSCKQKWKAQRNAAIAAKKRNDEFVRSLHEAQKQVHDTWSRLHSDQCGSSALLAQEKARYNRRVEQIFPAWQEQLQRQRVQKLRELEDKKRAVERRRYLAKKVSFEKEQTLDDLIRKTRHEVEMAENLEQNELYERDLLRTQSTNQAMEVDQSIREVALEARSILQQQATKHFEAAPELDEDLADLLEPFSAASTPRNAQPAEDDMILSSMQSDDFESLASSMKPTADINSSVPTNDTLMNDNVDTVVSSVEDHTSPPEPPIPAPEEVNTASITEKLSPVDRVKALGALISRVEEGANEGDTLGGSTDTGSSYESKRELLKMAVGGRKAQIAFFGSDICFELILDISRDLGPVLFPPKAFEGIMNDQKIRKLHQSNKEKQLDLWKALSGHLKQLAQLKAIPAATLVDLFVTAFLAHDPDNQRSQRKLREFMVTVCGGGDSKTLNPHKETFSTFKPPSSHRQGQRTPSPEPAKPAEPEDRIGTPQLLQTAFLQRQSPPKPKVFGIASSSFKDRSSGSSDVLMSMSSGPMKLSQKLMRGGKMNDYSEFEEEEEVDLQNLIGTKPMFASGSSALSRSYQAAKTFPTGRLTGKSGAVEEESDEFDADF